MKSSNDETSGDFDAIVIVSLGSTKQYLGSGQLSKYLPILEEYKRADLSLEQEATLLPLNDSFPVRRLIYSPVGPVNRDFDDIRRFSEAAYKGVKRALKSGARKPIIAVPSPNGAQENYSYFDAATILGAYEAIYVVIVINIILS